MEKAINSLVPEGLRQKKKKKKQRSKGRGKERECREKLVTEEGMTAHKRPPKKKKNASKLFLFPAEFGEMRTNFMVT